MNRDDEYTRQVKEQIANAKTSAEKLKVFILKAKDIIQENEQNLTQQIALFRADPNKYMTEKLPKDKAALEMAPKRFATWCEQGLLLYRFQAQVELKQIDICLSIVDTQTDHAQKLVIEINARLQKFDAPIPEKLGHIKRIKELLDWLPTNTSENERQMSKLRKIYKGTLEQDPPLEWCLINPNFKRMLIDFYSNLMTCLVMEIKFITDFPELHPISKDKNLMSEMIAAVTDNKAYVRGNIYTQKSAIDSVADSLKNIFLSPPAAPADSAEKDDSDSEISQFIDIIHSQGKNS